MTFRHSLDRMRIELDGWERDARKILRAAVIGR